jgi:hypothetical protein
MIYYQLDATKLRLGDVILEVGSGLILRLIKFVDRGKYSHALLYLGANCIVDADEDAGDGPAYRDDCEGGGEDEVALRAVTTGAVHQRHSQGRSDEGRGSRSK